MGVSKNQGSLYRLQIERPLQQAHPQKGPPIDTETAIYGWLSKLRSPFGSPNY